MHRKCGGNLVVLCKDVADVPRDAGSVELAPDIHTTQVDWLERKTAACVLASTKGQQLLDNKPRIRFEDYVFILMLPFQCSGHACQKPAVLGDIGRGASLQLASGRFLEPTGCRPACCAPTWRTGRSQPVSSKAVGPVKNTAQRWQRWANAEVATLLACEGRQAR